MPGDVFCFFSKSKSADPGRGTGESLSSLLRYEDLGRVADWRKVLSNFHVAKFRYDGLTWNSIEHAFQGCKIRLADPEKAREFALESGSELSRADGAAAQKQRKMVQLSRAQVAEWNLVKTRIMDEAAASKFSQNGDAMEILKLTGDAELWHRGPRIRPVRFAHLETIRSW